MNLHRQRKRVLRKIEIYPYKSHFIGRAQSLGISNGVIKRKLREGLQGKVNKYKSNEEFEKSYGEEDSDNWTKYRRKVRIQRLLLPFISLNYYMEKYCEP